MARGSRPSLFFIFLDAYVLRFRFCCVFFLKRIFENLYAIRQSALLTSDLIHYFQLKKELIIEHHWRHPSFVASGSAIKRCP